MTAETVVRFVAPATLAGREAARVEAGVLEAGAKTDQRLSVLIKEFLAADEASRAAHEVALLQNSTVADDEAERLYGEAEDAWTLIVRETSASGAEVPEDVLDLGWEYWRVQSQMSMPAPAAAGDWHESVAAVDWSRSRS